MHSQSGLQSTGNSKAICTGQLGNSLGLSFTQFLSVLNGHHATSLPCISLSLPLWRTKHAVQKLMRPLLSDVLEVFQNCRAGKPCTLTLACTHIQASWGKNEACWAAGCVILHCIMLQAAVGAAQTAMLRVITIKAGRRWPAVQHLHHALLHM